MLHYSALNEQIKDGDVVVIDVGGEYGGYAADITRTLPANGKFTARQREIYEIVLGAQNAAMAAVKPGATIHGGAVSLNADRARLFQHARPRSAMASRSGNITFTASAIISDSTCTIPATTTRPLEPGMVITVEPGIYIPEENLGVRIEDDVLVTKDGIEVLTKRLPRNPDEVEKVMAEGAKN